MRILHVVPTYYPAVRYGGTIRAVHELARAQAVGGHDVHVFTTNVDGPGCSGVPLGRPLDRDGVQVWYFPTGAGRRLYRSPAMGRALDESLAGFSMAHLHSVFLWPTAKAASAARRFGVPYMMTPHGMLAEELIRRRSTAVKRAWIALFERRNIRGAAAVHVTAEAEAKDLLKLGFQPRRVVIAPNGVEPPAGLRREESSGKPYVLFLGRVNWKKGLDRLIPAMRFLPDVPLIVAGNDEENYQPKMEALARLVGVEKRVHFTGPADDAEKWRLISGARLLVLPSYNENFGIVVLEAMAVGCPVVVSAGVGLSEAVRKAGAGVVASGDSQSLAAAMEVLLGDAELRNSMGEAGRRAAGQEFSWQKIARQMDQIYQDCLSCAVRDQ